MSQTFTQLLNVVFISLESLTMLTSVSYSNLHVLVRKLSYMNIFKLDHLDQFVHLTWSLLIVSPRQSRPRRKIAVPLFYDTQPSKQACTQIMVTDGR